MENGFIEDQKTTEDYEKKSHTLTCQVLSKAKIVFCTIIALWSSNLGPKVKGKKDWWLAQVYVIDETGCANPGEVVIPIITYTATLK